MEPVSRRTAAVVVGIGALGAAGGIAAVTGALGPLSPGRTTTGSASAGTPGDALREPTVLRSEGGILEVRLEAARGSHPLAGRSATTLAYNGEVPGPTLRLRAGDLIRIELVNSFDETTNLHVHGLHVSPEGNSDNVFVAVGPGSSFSYEYQLPRDHPSGTFWYHPHHHGMVADQLFAGLYGAIVVEEREPLPVTRERLLVVSDITLDAAGGVAAVSMMDRMTGREGELLLVDGQVAPTVRARPGEREHWRVVNTCPSRFLSLRMEGTPLVLLRRDSGRLATPTEAPEVFLAPGNRVDLVVTAGQDGGVLRALPVDRGSMPGAMMGDRPASASTEPVDLLVLEVADPPVDDLPALPLPPPPRDLSADDVARERVLTLAMGMGMGMGGGPGRGMSLTIDGREFDHERVDQQVELGTVEAWTIVNTSEMDHPFHLHVWPMQVLRQGGRAVETPTWLDVVNVPARSEVEVRIAFEDFGGRTVYHCHVLDHEDLGMMGVIEAR